MSTVSTVVYLLDNLTGVLKCEQTNDSLSLHYRPSATVKSVC